MRIHRAQIVASILLLSWACAFGAQSTESVNRAVDAHKNGAPDKAHEMELVANLASLASKDSKAWLPDFWAAYLLTQVSMSHRDGAPEVLAQAQEHIERAFTRAKKVDGAPLGDLHALQGLVYSFQSNYATEREAGLRYKSLMKEESAKSYENDRSSPVLMVMAATELIGSGGEKTWPQVLAARALMAEANRRFESTKTPRGETTHFNSEWVRPWLGWIDRMIEKGLDAE